MEAEQQRFIAASGVVYVGHMLAGLLQLAAHYWTVVVRSSLLLSCPKNSHTGPSRPALALNVSKAGLVYLHLC